MDKEKLAYLQAKAKKLRYDCIEMIGHFGVVILVAVCLLWML